MQEACQERLLRMQADSTARLEAFQRRGAASQRNSSNTHNAVIVKMKETSRAKLQTLQALSKKHAGVIAAEGHHERLQQLQALSTAVLRRLVPESSSASLPSEQALFPDKSVQDIHNTDHIEKRQLSKVIKPTRTKKAAETKKPFEDMVETKEEEEIVIKPAAEEIMGILNTKNRRWVEHALLLHDGDLRSALDYLLADQAKTKERRARVNQAQVKKIEELKRAKMEKAKRLKQSATKNAKQNHNQRETAIEMDSFGKESSAMKIRGGTRAGESVEKNVPHTARIDALGPEYEKFKNMLKMGVPEGAVRAKMALEHVDAAPLFGESPGRQIGWQTSPLSNSMGTVTQQFRQMQAQQKQMTKEYSQRHQAPQFQVQVPPNVMAGSIMRVTLPDGRLMDVQVPPGVLPGQMLSLAIPS